MKQSSAVASTSATARALDNNDEEEEEDDDDDDDDDGDLSKYDLSGWGDESNDKTEEKKIETKPSTSAPNDSRGGNPKSHRETTYLFK